VIVVCGTPASGKSHLAASIARACGLAQISSDQIRKRLAGVEPAQRAPGTAYTEAFNARTYAEIAADACAALGGRGGAIVDATFRHRSDRRTFASALCSDAPVLFVECQAPLPVLAARAHARRQDDSHSSDADLDVVLREHARWEPLDEIDPCSHVVLRTDRPAGDVVADLLALLDRRLGRIAPAR
jgi:predicted kinase